MKKSYRMLSWNVNGIRAIAKKNFICWLQKELPDVLCLQETKALPAQVPPEVRSFPGYEIFWSSAERPGYSGVATYSKEKPQSVSNGFGVACFDTEGRVLRMDYSEFTLFNIYFPNGKSGPERLKYKMDFYDAALDTFLQLKKKKRKLVICGDVNTAHKAIDLAHPKENEKISGFLPQERAWIDKLIHHGFIDAFRALDPRPEQYSWWDLRTGARARNVGWRIDYYFISEELRPNLKEAFLMPQVMGSDHCPVGIVLSFS